MAPDRNPLITRLGSNYTILETTQVVEKNGGQGRNRTTDTRIFSIRLCLSAEFSIDPNTLNDVGFWPMPLQCMFYICRSGSAFF